VKSCLYAEYIPGWIQIYAVFPAYGGDIMTNEEKDVKREEISEVEGENSESDMNCCCVVDYCGCVADPCGCYVETCCC
jgi:hypothetical protein